MNLRDIVYNYDTESKYGFKDHEIHQLLITKIIRNYPQFNMQKFESTFMGNTCMMDENDGKFIYYHCDVLLAINCGIDNREINNLEFD
jgi:hypothetical protein